MLPSQNLQVSAEDCLEWPSHNTLEAGSVGVPVCLLDTQTGLLYLSVPSECPVLPQPPGTRGLAEQLSGHCTTAEQHYRFPKFEPFQKASGLPRLPILSCQNKSRWDNKAQICSSNLTRSHNRSSKGTKAAADEEGNLGLGLKYRSEN